MPRTPPAARPIGPSDRRRRRGAPAHTAAPRNGNASATAGNVRVDARHWPPRRASRIARRWPDAAQSIVMRRARGAIASARARCCWHEAGEPAHDERGDGGDVGVQHVARRHAVDPHHRRRRVADDAARAAGVRGRDDRGEVADVHGRKERCAIVAADQRGGDVVEERRQHEDHHQQHERRRASRRAAAAAALWARRLSSK